MKKQVRNNQYFLKIMSLVMVALMISGFFSIVNPYKVSAVPVIHTNQIYEIRSKYSGKYIGLRDVRLSRGQFGGVETRIEQQDSNAGTQTQRFRILPSQHGGYYKIVSVHNHLPLDVRGFNGDKNAQLQLYHDNNTSNQQFMFYLQSDGTYKIKARHSGQYLTIREDSRDNGADIVQWPFKSSGVENQSWYLEPVDTVYPALESFIVSMIERMGVRDDNFIIRGAKLNLLSQNDNEIREAIREVKSRFYPDRNKYYRLKSRYSRYYLSIKSGSTSTGAEIELRRKIADAQEQMFQIIEHGNSGFFKIKNKKSRYVFDVYASGTGNNEKIIQYYDTGTDNQKFELYLQPGGYFKIKAKHSGQMLTIYDDNREEYARLVQWPDKSSDYANQLWELEEVEQYESVQSLVTSEIHHNDNMIIDDLLAKAQLSNLNASRQQIEEAVDSYINRMSRNTPQLAFTGNNFITTYGMLNKRVDEITYMGAHNAFSNNEDAKNNYSNSRSLGTENHKYSIAKQLQYGYRVIDLDIGKHNGNTGCYHRYRLAGYTNLWGPNSILPKIKIFLDENPGDIVILHLSEVYNGNLDLTTITTESLYPYGTEEHEGQVENMMFGMKETGLLEMTYNYTGNNNTPRDQYFENLNILGDTQGSWPVLKDMLKSNKRVLLIQRDEGFGHTVRLNNEADDPTQVSISDINFSSNTLNELGSNGSRAGKMVNLELFLDWGAAAGDINAAYVNNDGEHLYDIFTEVNRQLREGNTNKVMTFALLDYVVSTTHSSRPDDIEVTAIQAANRLNYDNFGYEWSRDRVINYWD